MTEEPGELEKSSRPKFRHRVARGSRKQLRIFDQLIHPDRFDIFQRLCQSQQQSRIGRPGGFSIRGIFLFSLKVEIEARRVRSIAERPSLRADREESKPAGIMNAF